MHLGQRGEVESRCFGHQLLPATKPIAHRHGLQAIAARADQIMLSVTDHQRLRRVQPFFVQQMANQLNLVGARAVQFAAVDHLEVVVEGEVPGNFAGKLPRFGSGDIQRAALAVQGLEQLRHAGEHQVFVQPGHAEALAVEIDRLPRLGFVETIELHERLQQRWADEVLEAGQVWLIDAQLCQGILDRAGDAQAWVGQGAVEVEQDVLLVHVQGSTQMRSFRLIEALGQVLVLELHIVAGAVGEKRPLLVIEQPRLFHRAAHVQVAADQALAWRHQAAGANDHFILHDRTVHDRAAHADQNAVTQRAAMQHHLVTDGHFVADDQREAVRVERAGVGDMQHAAVLHAGARTNPDAVHVAAHHGQWPDRAVFADFNVAQHHRRTVDECPGPHFRSVLLEAANGHDSVSHLCR